MKFVVAVLALLFPAVAFAQVLPLEDVMQTRIFSARFNGPIHHLDNSMKPSKDGHAGYEPKQKATSSCASVDEYVTEMNGLGWDVIKLKGDDADKFWNPDPDVGDLAGYIEYLAFIDPKDADYEAAQIFIAAYDVDGCYIGEGKWPREDVIRALEWMNAPPPATAEKPAA